MPETTPFDIAVFYENDSGLGDVGKHVISHALEQGIHVRAIAQGDPNLITTSASVRDVVITKDQEETNQLTKYQINNMTAKKQISMNDQDLIEKSINNVDAIIICSCNRQIGHERNGFNWINNIISIIKQNNIKCNKVQRIILLSSMGIDNDYPPMEYSCLIGSLFTCLLSCPGLLRSAYYDLLNMENILLNNNDLADSSSSTDNNQDDNHDNNGKVDYLIIRPVGLDPETVPRGIDALTAILSIKSKSKQGDGRVPPLEVTVAKEDVASFILKEAVIMPSFHNQIISIGYQRK